MTFFRWAKLGTVVKLGRGTSWGLVGYLVVAWQGGNMGRRGRSHH